ncbi:uncharacterized protein LOC18421620 [Amborella trichopoda]|uniref:C2 NT-type domain-containing protein n=1 Tax=Amborella trichopoda TaxID=13333 RepID=W1NE86_AMBTC|nr:uncharacterized protein LOC18421620 [Amborella trichopoda]ERM93669.1 hypothetical protein AMTR_s00004p00168070 [Amborella trichopoda]|eukprot:XP_006826432.1 uncharacterized protein LOC18421620 [Amborella trichopoda]
MVVKMIKWRPWPPLVKKYQVKLVLHRIEGFREIEKADGLDSSRVTVEIKWKGPRAVITSLRRKVKRNFTAERDYLHDEGFVEFDEEFGNVCGLSVHKENFFYPWEIAFTILNGLNQGPKTKTSVIGTASMNLADYASPVEGSEIEIKLPFSSPGVSIESSPFLFCTLSLLELRAAQESSDTVQRSIAPLSPVPGEAPIAGKDELSALKAGLSKVKLLADIVSARKAKKACREDEGSDPSRYSIGSNDAYPLDSDSLDEFEEGEVEDGKEDSSIRKSFSYGTLASANFVGGSYYSGARIDGEDEDWVYYSNRKSDVGTVHSEDQPSASEQSILQSSKRSILSWRKRKLSFRSPRTKGEPLLKKAYGEEGGDDIDYDRRQLSSSSDESLSLGMAKAEDEAAVNRLSVSEFGDDNFAVGRWEAKELISRDGHMKLNAHVFFASIDQRSERAAGESACTALVAVIADWLQANPNSMPIKSQFDSLIREGSREWRSLCENEAYRERFPDKHFDLETVLQAKIRPLSVLPEKSFVGFFHPDGSIEGLDFLQGAMSFDNIWDEISAAASYCKEGDFQVYVVSWNDHFFVLKVEPEAYYIMDTLGERLFEGCNQAYVLRFDSDTVMYELPEEEEKPMGEDTTIRRYEQQEEGEEAKQKEEELVCKGKETCKEYIKKFLAAIPLRELQADVKKGRMAAGTLLHHRLQIEFHYTALSQTELAVV